MHHRLSGGHHLADIGGQGGDHAVGIRRQHRIAGLSPGHVPLRRRRGRLGHGAIRRRTDLIIGESRHSPALGQGPQPPLVRGCAVRLSLCRPGLGLGRRQGQGIVLGVEAGQGLPLMHMRAEVHQTLRHLAGHAEAQVRLDPGPDHAAELVVTARCGRHHRSPDQGRLRAGIALLRRAATGQGQDGQTETEAEPRDHAPPTRLPDRARGVRTCQ